MAKSRQSTSHAKSSSGAEWRIDCDGSWKECPNCGAAIDFGNDKSSSARLSVPIAGPKHSGVLRVSGDWRKGVWNLSIWVVYDDDGEERTIAITRQVE